MTITPVDTSNLALVEQFSDGKAGSIIRYTPVTLNGIQDPLRRVYFKGQTYLTTNQGPMPLTFDLAGDTIEQAITSFVPAVQQVIEDLQSKAIQQTIESGGKIDLSRLKPRTN